MRKQYSKRRFRLGLGARESLSDTVTDNTPPLPSRCSGYSLTFTA